jgi:L-asparaginase II
MTPDALAPVAVTTRSGIDESVHFGVVVALAPSGDIEFAVGDPTVVVYPRSSNKPMQAVAMVRAGLDIEPDLLALACASHDGTPAHLDGVRRLLAVGGLDESALHNTADLPIERAAARDIVRHGGGPTRLQMNCSGKHAAMLVTSVGAGWPHDESYLDADHPLQQRITATIEELTGETCAHIGVDGCGAPAHAYSLVGLATAFRSIATGAAGTAGDRVASAIRANPVMLGGEHRDVSLLVAHIPGLVAKDGAQGVYAAALPDGRAVALKIGDGGDRARAPVMLAALRRLGVDVDGLEPLVSEPVLGHGHPVGEVRVIAP